MSDRSTRPRHQRTVVAVPAVPSSPPRAVIARIWLLVLAVCVLASLPVGAAGADTPLQADVSPPTSEPLREGPSIGSGQEPLSGDLRTSEGVELRTATERATASGVASAHAIARRGDDRLAAPDNLPAVWCDVVQCRRQSGAQLLHYATPPPLG